MRRDDFSRHLMREHVLTVNDLIYPVFVLDVEMVMVVGIGIEIGSRALDCDLTQQASLGELVQRVVDGGERHWHLGRQGFRVQILGG